MKKLFLALLLVLGIPATACSQFEQQVTNTETTTFITVNYGVMMDPAFSQLRKAWSTDPKQLERGYCIVIFSESGAWARDSAGNKLGREHLVRVWAVDTAQDIKGATPSEISQWACPSGQPMLHIHPPTTCENDADLNSCVYGGVSAWQCQPSRADLMTLLSVGKEDDLAGKFGVIQCGPEEFRFYWPTEYRP